MHIALNEVSKTKPKPRTPSYLKNTEEAIDINTDVTQAKAITNF